MGKENMNTGTKKIAYFVLSNKGGVGKSTISKLMLELFIARNLNVQAFDCDSSVGSLIKIYGDTGLVQNIDIKNVKVQGNIINFAEKAFNEGKDYLLYDMPAGEIHTLADLMGNPIELINEFKAIGYAVKFIVPISTDKTSLNPIDLLLPMVEGHAEIIIVKNLGFGAEEDDFIFFDKKEFGGDKYQDLINVSSKVIQLPLLKHHVYSIVNYVSNKPYSTIIENKLIERFDTGLLRNWMVAFHNQLEINGAIFK